MILLLALSAQAGTCITINGAGCHTTLDEAITTATSGSTLRLPAGTFDAGLRVTKNLTLLGAGIDQTVLVSPTTASTLTSDTATGLSVESLTIEASSAGALHALQGALTLSEVAVSGLDGLTAGEVAIVHDGGTLTARDVDFVLTSTTGGGLHTTDTAVTLERVTMTGQFSTTTPVLATGGTWLWTDVTLDEVRASTPIAEATGMTEVDLRRVRAACASSSDALFSLQADALTLGPMLIWKSDATTLLELEATGAAQGVLGASTLLAEPGGTVVTLSGLGATWSLHDSVFVGGTAVSSPGSNIAQGVYNLYDTPTLASGSISGSPLLGAGSTRELPEFMRLGAGSDCTADLLEPLEGGNLVDTGDPASFDEDGSRADRGATGGADGFVLIRDADADGFLETVDCDDTDPSVYPGATEIPFDSIDQDCDGGDLLDADGDGVDLANDCDDDNDTVFPGAPEHPDTIDHDCDGFADPAVAPTYSSCSTVPLGAGYLSFCLVPWIRRRRFGA